MDRKLKLDLVQRSLGLKHKLKVHDSMKQPETHEEAAIMSVARWEFEDELRAIEEILAEDRNQMVAEKRAKLLREGVVKNPLKNEDRDAEEEDSGHGPANRPKKKR